MTLPPEMWRATPSPANIPEPVARALASLAARVALVSRNRPSRSDVMMTVRMRPVDKQGQTGCWAEVRSMVDSSSVTLARARRLFSRPAVGAGRDLPRPARTDALSQVTVRGTLSGGWMLGVDARWDSTE